VALQGAVRSSDGASLAVRIGAELSYKHKPSNPTINYLQQYDW